MLQISYQHIKTYLAMQNCGISSDDIQPVGHQTGKDGELVNNESEMCHAEMHREADISAESLMKKCDLEMDKEVPSGSIKRRKVSDTAEINSTKLKATESSIVEWLKNLDEGVSEECKPIYVSDTCIYFALWL